MCKIHTLYSIIYSTLYKVYGTQILYGHFDVLLFTYGVPLSCSNKDSSFQWKDAGVLVTSTTTRYNIYIVFLPQLLSLSREPLLSDLLHMSEHIHKVCLEKKGDLCCNINMSSRYSIVWYTIMIKVVRTTWEMNFFFSSDCYIHPNVRRERGENTSFFFQWVLPRVHLPPCQK